MSEAKKILQGLTSEQKSIVSKASEPGATVLFNIKGMVQILRNDEPFEFIEMGYEDIDKLKKKGVLAPIRTMKESNVLQGEIYTLSPLGRDIAKLLGG
jgi:hypothetical protein